MYPKKLEADKKQYYFRDGEYFDGEDRYIRTYLHADYKHKMHSHEFYEINIIMSGRGRHYIDEVSLDTEVGDVFVIPPGVNHGYYSDESIDIYHILIKNDFFSKYGDIISRIDGFDLLFDIEPQIRRASGRNHNLNKDSYRARMYEEKLNEMNLTEKQGRYTHLDILALDFICSLCERIQEDTSECVEKDVLRVIEYIRGNLEKKLTLKQLSDMANMSVSTFNRHFRAVLGVSPMNYVIQCRTERAKALISDRMLTRTEIAQICGFYDLAHMNKYI